MLSRAFGRFATHSRIEVLTLAAAIAVSICFWPGPARAGTYTAWFCANAAGQGIGLHDWFREMAGVGYISDGGICPPDGPGGTFGIWVGSDSRNDPNSVSDGFTILAPGGVRFDRMRLLWSGGASANGRVSAATVIDGQEITVLASYTNSTFGALPDEGGRFATYELAGARGISLMARCLASCQEGAGAEPFAWYSVYRVALSISDLAPPQGRANGGLLVDTVLKGAQSVTVEGRDGGAGIYLARVVVDGQVRATEQFGDRPCRDIDPSNADPYEFSAAQPCPATGSTTVVLDTTQLGEDAYHHVQVEIVDAAGDATVVADRVVGVDNRPLPAGFFDATTRRFANPVFDIGTARRLNGLHATADARMRVYLPRGTNRSPTRARLKRTVGFHSRPTIRGVLTDGSGHPIAGAAVWMASRVEGADWRISGRPHTASRTGRVAFRLPAGVPSRQVNLVYFPYSDSHVAALARPVVLKVRAGVSLRTRERAVHNGQRVTFIGRVAGRIPAGGTTVALQAKVGRRFRTFRQLRVTRAARGRFATRYRFKATTRTTVYRFRALVLKQSNLHFETGWSKVTTLTVRA